MNMFKKMFNWRMFGRAEATLTKKETKLLLKIARQNGCDWDGDVLRIYVNEQQGIVKPLLF
jgi:uncharacterized protein (UPF0276 family)